MSHESTTSLSDDDLKHLTRADLQELVDRGLAPDVAKTILNVVGHPSPCETDAATASD